MSRICSNRSSNDGKEVNKMNKKCSREKIMEEREIKRQG